MSGDFARFLAADGLGALGSAFYQVALPSLAMSAAGSAAGVAAVILASGAARIGLMPFFGFLCDRVPPRSLVASAAILRAALLLGLSACAAAGLLQFNSLCLFGLGLGACEALHAPARGAVVPRLVPWDGLGRANTLLSSQEKLLAAAGPGIAGIISARMGIEPALAFNALLLAGGAMLYAGIGTGRGVLPSEPPRMNPGSSKDLLRSLRQDSTLGASVALVLLTNLLSAGPLFVGLPVLAASRFGGHPEVLGLWMSAAGCGSLLGAAASGLATARTSQGALRTGYASLALLAAGLGGLLLAPSAGMAALGAGLVAGAASLANVLGVTQVQQRTPPGHMGKMMAFLNLK